MLYWVYGFPLRSEIELPELRAAAAAQLRTAGDDVVEIRVGAVPETLPDEVRLAPWLAFAPGQWLISVAEVGRVLVEEGRRITADKAPGAPESDLRTYLLGSGLGALLHQRGQIPLHVGAVLSPAGAVAFTGPSGAGKSTAVATISQELGWPIVSDDVAVLSIEGDRVMLEGGVCRLRLWRDALDRLNLPTEGLVRDIHRHEKFLVHRHNLFVEGPHALVLLYEIAPENNCEVPACVRGGHRFSMIMNSVYRPAIAKLAHDPAVLQQRLSAVANIISFEQGCRPNASTALEILSRIRGRGY